MWALLEDLLNTQRRNSCLLSLGSRLGLDLFHQARDAVLILFSRQVLPARKRSQNEFLFRRVLQSVKGLAPVAGCILLSLIEP